MSRLEHKGVRAPDKGTRLVVTASSTNRGLPLLHTAIADRRPWVCFNLRLCESFTIPLQAVLIVGKYVRSDDNKTLYIELWWGFTKIWAEVFRHLEEVSLEEAAPEAEPQEREQPEQEPQRHADEEEEPPHPGSTAQGSDEPWNWTHRRAPLDPWTWPGTSPEQPREPVAHHRGTANQESDRALHSYYPEGRASEERGHGESPPQRGWPWDPNAVLGEGPFSGERSDERHEADTFSSGTQEC